MGAIDPRWILGASWLLACLVCFVAQIIFSGFGWPLPWFVLAMNGGIAMVGATLMVGLVSASLRGLGVLVGWPRLSALWTKRLNAAGVVGLVTTLWLAVSFAMFRAVYWIHGLPFLAEGEFQGIFGLFAIVVAAVLGAIGVATVVTLLALPVAFRVIPKSWIFERRSRLMVVGALALLLTGVWGGATIVLASGVTSPSTEFIGGLILGHAGLVVAVAMVTLAAVALLILRTLKARSE